MLSAHAAMIANFSERAQQEVWGDDPCALASSSLSSIGRFKRVDGGYLVSGFWRYSSGCDCCVWLLAGADAEESDETGRRARRRFLLPILALEIVDDRHVLGLSGTGSKSLRGKVPEWRSFSDREFLANTGPGRSLHDDRHLYRLSRYAHPGPLSLAMAEVGVAQHAVDYCTAHVDRMGVGRTSAVEPQAIRHDIAEATTEVDAARLLSRRTVSEIERADKARIEPVSRPHRAGRARPSFRHALCAARDRTAVPCRRLASTVRRERAPALPARCPSRRVANHPAGCHRRSRRRDRGVGQVAPQNVTARQTATLAQNFHHGHPLARTLPSGQGGVSAGRASRLKRMRSAGRFIARCPARSRRG